MQTTTVIKAGEKGQEQEFAIPLESASALPETPGSATVVQEISHTSDHVVATTQQLISKDPFSLQQTEMPLLATSGSGTILATAKIQASEFSDQANDASLKDVEILLDTTEIKASIPSPVTELAAKAVVLHIDGGAELPSIIIDSVKSTSSSNASLTNKSLSKVVLACDGTLLEEDGTNTMAEALSGGVTVMASPALPLLFDLTSAAAPVELPQPVHSSHASSTKDSDSNGLSVPHHHRGSANATGGNGHNGGGLVAKIAKSISSSPLLRSSRPASMGTSSSPNGSSSNLHLLSGSGSGTNGSSFSPQSPQSTTFTLAVTTLSALTLLSSVSQAAVVGGGNGGDHGGDNKSQIRGSGGSNGQLVNGGGNGGGGKTVAKLHRKGMDKLSAQQNQQQQRRLQNESSRRNSSMVGPQKSCLKKSPASRTQQRPLLPDGASSRRKKVTFAKGSTPSPSPTGSVVFIEPQQPYLQQQHQHQRPWVRQSQYVAGPVNGGQPIRVVPHPVQVIPSQPATHRAVVPFAESPVKSSTGSFSPRSRGTHHQQHHPFDSHPSRLSPQEKQTLENQDHQLLLHAHNAKDTPVMIGFVSHHESSEEENDDDESEEDEEDDGDGEDDEDRDGDHDDEDDEDDELESEEERVERRRVARVAWLAKYGDAFKQVYGAVPELPPI